MYIIQYSVLVFFEVNQASKRQVSRYILDLAFQVVNDLCIFSTGQVSLGAVCAFSGRKWKFWWAIGRYFNGRPPGE